MRWDLLDKFVVLKRGSHSRATKRFDGTEDLFQDHFPGNAMVPGALMLEMIAQTGGVLAGLSSDFTKEVILVKIIDAKFHADVPATADLTIDARLTEDREDGAWIEGEVYNKDQRVAEAKIMLAKIDRLAESGRAIVFHDAFMKHFNIKELASR